MGYQNIFDNFRRHIELEAAEEQEIIPMLTRRQFAKGQFITLVGETNKYTNYIITGSTRVFFVDQNGHEHNVQLGIAGWWTGDFPSFITQQPGMLFTQALEPTSTMSISFENLQVLYNRLPKFERFFRLLTQNAYASFQQRVLSNLSHDAEQRYVAFREAYPDMNLHISQKHIASYLGISAEFLSKIKKRLVAKERNRFSNP